MIRGICILGEKHFSDPTVQKLILEKFDKILFAGKQEGFDFYTQNRERLYGSMSLNGESKNEYPDLVPYFDEPISKPTADSKNWQSIVREYKNTIIGELVDSAFDKVSCPITYTAYKELWFTFSGWRVYKFWTNQLGSWKHIQNTFLNKFPIVWVKFGQSQKLLDWATENNKEVWYYSEDSLEVLIKNLKAL